MNITSIMADGASHSVSEACGGEDPFALARRLDAAIWVFDIDHSRIAFANASACKVWQAETEEELQNRELCHDMSPTVAKRLRQYQNDFTETDAVFTEMWTIYPGDKPRNLMVIYRGFRLKDGRMAMLCEVVGEFEDQPDNLRSAEALLHTDVMITLFSRGGPPLYMNPAARNTFGPPIPTFQSLFVDPADHDAVMQRVDSIGEQRIVALLNTSMGERWFDLSVKNCQDAATGKAASLVTAIDVTDLKEARDTARHLADRDQLTNLHNRSFMQNHLNWLEDSGLAVGSNVIFFDVDRFKLINDRYGHEAGDAVLCHIANRCRESLRAKDLVARLGGDEFVVVLEGGCSREALACQIDRLRQAVSEPVTHENTQIKATISVGVSQFREGSASFSDVLREADIALYRSKEEGRDRVTYFNRQMGKEVAARELLENELRTAIQKQEFELYYQPRMEIETGRIVGVEALVRWNHPTNGVVLPGAFIPVCEETGLIDELGRRVLEMGCVQAIEWQRQGLDFGVSINVSPRQFNDFGFLETLTYLANRADFPRDKLELEITETVLIGDHGAIADKLRKITAMGYRIAIDDFGTGYSNLSYISEFPLTCLKIDRSFIRQLPESGPIVQLIVTLGQQIGATVVSEGIETEEQMAWLAKNKCGEAQGYLIARPMPKSAFEEFLRNYPIRSK